MTLQDKTGAVASWLSSRHIHVLPEWTEACLEWIEGEYQGRNFSLEQLREVVYEQWLDSDLAEIATPCLPQGLAQHQKTTFQGVYTLQINSIQDVESSAYSQLIKIKGKENENVSVTATQATQNKFEPKPTRLLMMEITDGHQKLQAMEYKPISTLTTETPPGTKILVQGSIDCRFGVLTLSGQMVKVLGGEVEALVEENAQDKLLARIIGTTLEDLPQQNGPRMPLSDGSANQMQAQRDHHTSQGSNQFNANINNSKNETMHSKDTKQGYMKPSQSSTSRNDNYTSHLSEGDGAMVDFEDDLDEDDLAALDEEIIREMKEAECKKKKLMKPKTEIVKKPQVPPDWSSDEEDIDPDMLNAIIDNLESQIESRNKAQKNIKNEKQDQTQFAKPSQPFSVVSNSTKTFQQSRKPVIGTSRSYMGSSSDLDTLSKNFSSAGKSGLSCTSISSGSSQNVKNSSSLRQSSMNTFLKAREVCDDVIREENPSRNSFNQFSSMDATSSSLKKPSKLSLSKKPKSPTQFASARSNVSSCSPSNTSVIDKSNSNSNFKPYIKQEVVSEEENRIIKTSIGTNPTPQASVFVKAETASVQPLRHETSKEKKGCIQKSPIGMPTPPIKPFSSSAAQPPKVAIATRISIDEDGEAAAKRRRLSSGSGSMQGAPFTYLAAVMDKILDPMEPFIFSIRGFIITLLSALSKEGNRWSLLVKINDGTSSLDVELGNEVLKQFIGFSVMEMKEMRAAAANASEEEQKDMERRQRNGLENCRKILVDLCGILTIEIIPGETPTVKSFRKVDREDCQQMKRCLQVTS